MDPDHNDLFVEMIEVFIHSILYLRDIYPIGIFKKGQIYSKIIYQSIYPPLNEYIGNVLSTARQLKRLKELYKIELQIYQDDSNNTINVLENFVFEIKQLDDVFQINNKLDDKYLIEFEENLRIVLLNLDDKMKQLKKLPNGAKFKINLQTTQSNFVKLTNNNELENFPWIQEMNNLIHRNTPTTRILPIALSNTFGLQMYIENYY